MVFLYLLFKPAIDIVAKLPIIILYIICLPLIIFLSLLTLLWSLLNSDDVEPFWFGWEEWDKVYVRWKNSISDKWVQSGEITKYSTPDSKDNLLRASQPDNSKELLRQSRK